MQNKIGPVKDHLNEFEAMTILTTAQAVDDLWKLDRRNCNELCVEYRSMVELSQKYYLKRWTRCTEPWKSHELVNLYNLIQKYNHHRIAQCTTDSLRYVTQCGEFTKYKGVTITCAVFYHHAQFVDPYLESLWNVMDDPTIKAFRRRATAHP